MAASSVRRLPPHLLNRLVVGLAHARRLLPWRTATAIRVRGASGGRALRRIVVLGLLLTLPGVPADAQRLGFRLTTPATDTYGLVDLATGAARAASADEAMVDAVFSSDGAYALTARDGRLVVRHVPTGNQIDIPTAFRPRVAHPRRLMFFGDTGASDLVRLDVRGLVSSTPCAGTPTVSAYDLSVDGRELVVACPSSEILVLDTDTGAEVRRLPAGGPVGWVGVNASGDLVVCRGVGAGTEVARLDASTGAVLASRPGLPQCASTGSRHQLFELNLSSTPGISGAYRLVDMATLQVSRDVMSGPTLAVRVRVSPDGRQAVVNSAGYSVYTRSFASVIDIESGRALAGLTMALREGISVGVAFPPLAPVLAAASVSGGTVALSWTLPDASPQVTGYRLEAGLAPAATAVSIDLGPEPAVTIPGVPPGRYYVRLHAVNDNGASDPSNEVIVDVP